MVNWKIKIEKIDINLTELLRLDHTEVIHIEVIEGSASTLNEWSCKDANKTT